MDMHCASRTCHSAQRNDNFFVVSPDETWATHRRIVGKIWASRWEIKKVMMAVSIEGDKRVADVLWSVSVA